MAILFSALILISVLSVVVSLSLFSTNKFGINITIIIIYMQYKYIEGSITTIGVDGMYLVSGSADTTVRCRYEMTFQDKKEEIVSY